MVKKLLLVVVALVVGFLGFAMTRPSTYHVERSAKIAAPVEVVYPELASLENGFVKWSPWEKRDPAMKKVFSGPKDGAGATYHWEGNKDVGKGTMTVTEVRPNELVKEDLEFIEPFASKCTITMSLAKDGDGSKVTWAMDGNADFMTKVMGIFAPMDKMIGPDFEAGLTSLQTIAVDDAKKVAAAKAAAAAAAAAVPPPAPTDAPPPVGAPPPAPTAPAKG